MKSKKLYKHSLVVIFVLVIIISALIAFLYTGHTKKVESDEEYEVAFETVHSMNSLGGSVLIDFDTGNGSEYGLIIERLDDGFRIYMGSELEKCIDSICENYSKSTNGAETVAPENVVRAITEDVKQTINDCELSSTSRRDNFLFKLFKWCGESCKDNAVFNEESNGNRGETEKSISNGVLTNYSVIRKQHIFNVKGEVCPYKFKWQQ